MKKEEIGAIASKIQRALEENRDKALDKLSAEWEISDEKEKVDSLLSKYAALQEEAKDLCGSRDLGYTLKKMQSIYIKSHKCPAVPSINEITDEVIISSMAEKDVEGIMNLVTNKYLQS